MNVQTKYKLDFGPKKYDGLKFEVKRKGMGGVVGEPFYLCLSHAGIHKGLSFKYMQGSKHIHVTGPLY